MWTIVGLIILALCAFVRGFGEPHSLWDVVGVAILVVCLIVYERGRVNWWMRLFNDKSNRLVEWNRQTVELGKELTHKPSFDRRDDAKYRALMFSAAWNGDLATIDLLALIQPDIIDAQSKFFTPMHAAVHKKRHQAVELLFRLGSRAMNANICNGGIFMQVAARNNDCPMIKLLFRLGLQTIDSCDATGDTPMHVAARWGYSSVIELLIQLGSQAPYKENCLGYTPIDTAAFDMRRSALKTFHYLGYFVERYGGVCRNEEKARRIRHRVYFRESLVQRCLESKVC